MSYNSLFGLGSHSPDASLEGWWKFDDNAASAVVTDYSGNSRNLTLGGGSNTSAKSAAGPESWIGGSLDLNGSSDFIDGTGTASLSGGDFTAGVRAYNDNTGNVIQYATWHLEASGNGNIIAIGRNNDKAVFARWNDDLTSATSRFNTSSWKNLVGRFRNSDKSQTILVDGALDSSRTATYSVSTSDTTVTFGRRRAITNYWDGELSDAWLFSRYLTDDEVAEQDAGPEPLNTVAPTLTFGGSTWTGTIGTWDSQSNGTITYAWELRLDSDDSVVQSGTGSSPSGSNPADGSYYLWVRGTNDGGFDSAEDSVSTTQVLGGGGGGFKPYWANRRSQLIGWAA